MEVGKIQLSNEATLFTSAQIPWIYTLHLFCKESNDLFMVMLQFADVQFAQFTYLSDIYKKFNTKLLSPYFGGFCIKIKQFGKEKMLFVIT